MQVGGSSVLTKHPQRGEETDRWVGGHLTLVHAVISHLDVTDVQLPVLRGRRSASVNFQTSDLF